MEHLDGSIMGDKMVDFAFVLNLNDKEDENIRCTTAKYESKDQSVNQNFMAPIRYKPSFAVSETKIPLEGGQKSKT